MREQIQKLRQRNPEKGAALLTVLVALMIITILLFEFQYASMVERKLAYNELNQMQAYYLAKSGARIGALRVALYARLKADPKVKQALSAGGNPAMLDQIWQMSLPAFPPDASTLKQLFKADQDAAETVLKETKITEGQYTVSIRSESAKLNLNSLLVPSNQTSQRPNFTTPPTAPHMYVGLMLVNLLNGFLKESDNPYDDYPDLHPEELVMDIMDWVTPGDGRLMGGSKDAFYTALTPPYKAKKGRFFTIDELRLVKGIDGRLFEKLKPYVTVYSYDSKLNINNAGDAMYRAIFPDLTDDDLKKINEQRSKLGQWSSEKQFADFIIQTLGRSGFSTLYPDASKYPFTVGTESFLIESLGMIKKSASSISRTVTVALAFTTGKGGRKIEGMSEADCKKSPASQFWKADVTACFTNPRTKDECEGSFPGSTAMPADNPSVCNIMVTSGFPAISIPMQAAAPATSAGASGAAATAPAKPAGSNTMKILYWAES